MRNIIKFLLKLIRIALFIYGILFAVFYWDLDGKFMYYIWEPFMIKRFDNMKRPDATGTPYSMKESVE
jgi:hypothetical protein